MKWFIKCFRQYADFDGRARRKEYWWFALINYIIMMVLALAWILMACVSAWDGEYDEVVHALVSNPFLYIFMIYYMAILIPSIAVMVRRLHDIGKSGFWGFFIYGGSLLGSIATAFSEVNFVVYMFLALASLTICVISLVWMFTDSQYGPNKYGPNPKGEGNSPDETNMVVE